MKAQYEDLCVVPFEDLNQFSDYSHFDDIVYNGHVVGKCKIRYIFFDKVYKETGKLACAACGDTCTKIVLRKEIGAKSSFLVLCTEKRTLTVDHIIPKANKGPNKLGNYQLLCEKCNCRKGDKIIKSLTKQVQQNIENEDLQFFEKHGILLVPGKIYPVSEDRGIQYLCNVSSQLIKVNFIHNGEIAKANQNMKIFNFTRQVKRIKN